MYQNTFQFIRVYLQYTPFSITNANTRFYLQVYL